MIPVIMKGETSKPIQLALKEGFEYSGCALHVNFCGLRDTFVDLAAGGSVELRYTAEQTARLPLGTSKVMLSIENARNEICFMPWAKIKVTDCPEDVRDAQITIDPATLNVEDLTSKDTLASVKSRVNAVMAFLRGLSALAILALPIYALSDVAPLTAPLDDIPGDTPLMTNVLPYVDAKVAAVPAPDYSTNNPQLVATIGEVAPPADLTPATNYTDAALGAFAETGTVARASTYGTPTRWTDATGCVWEVSFSLSPWSFSGAGVANYSNLSVTTNEDFYVLLENDSFVDYGSEFGLDLLDVHFANAAVVATRSIVPSSTNIVGRVALTNDIPAVPEETDPTVPSWAKASSKPAYSWGEITGKPGLVSTQDVESIIREKSLGGIWDSKLGVWWTPDMADGALHYYATTNVNLNVEGDE